MNTKSKKLKLFNRVVAFALAAIMAIPNMSMGQAVAGSSGTSTYVLDATADLTAFAAGTKADGETEVVGTNGYFTVVYSAKTKVDSSSKTFEDGYSATQRINMGGASVISESSVKNAIKFTTTDTATVKVWWVCGGDNREIAIFDEAGTSLTATSVGCIKNSLYISELSVSGAGTYYLGSAAGSNYYFKVEVTEGAASSSESSEASSEASEATTEASEATTEASQATTEASEATTEASQATTEASEASSESSEASGKIDVWDFGAEQLDTTLYNNKITVDEVNSWYPSVAAGTTGKNLASFTTIDGELSFSDGGYSTTHRLRTMNASLTCYDRGKYLVDAEGKQYNGFIYSNKGANANVYVAVKCEPGDIITLVSGSNGTDGIINFEAPSGAVVQKDFVSNATAGSKHAQISTFYATESGMHKFYYTKEKLVVARIYREHTNVVPVTGAVSAPAELTGYSVVFTNTANGQVTEAPVTNGAYSTNLNTAYTYNVSLKNANGYVITSAKSLSVDKAAQSATLDITVIAVELVTVTGNITGLSADALAKLDVKFSANAIFKPEVVITGNTYSVEVEVGTEYDVVVSGVNDYNLTSNAKVSYAAAGTADITFAAKPTYAVTINPVGATASDLAGATFTFTNLNEEGYVYKFTGTEGIVLRDGTYSVVVSNSGRFVQELTSNLVVNGAAVSKTIPFNGNVTVWDFTAADFAGKFTTAGAGNYNGLGFTNAGNNKNTYLLSNAGTISVPVSGPCQIQVTACYKYSFYFAENTEASVNVNTGSTSQMDTYTYNYTGAAGTVDVTVLGQSYFCKIEVLDVVAYKETITVGATGCDYTTINDALDAVAAMPRPNNERVTISIQPGDYEEMLVINVPNVTLKNASATPSIALTNKGVDIDANAVRITHYYGHGYTYYSMGSDCKYDEDILRVNKENGYASFENPGSGSTAGSFWNATVVIGADGFEAEGIIFENSFNQYVSAKAANDVIVAQSSAKEPASAPRASLAEGSTAVQDKAYVERAAALAIRDNVKKVSFDNCKFIGRQDTLYGGKNATAAFYGCDILGGTDYIFGGMTAVFAKCNLVFNTSEDGNDKGYITAPQQASGRGYLMYNCTVTSTTPGVDTASEFTSKPGYLGRPWATNTGEAVFYKTVIDAADTHWYETSPSLIMPEAWLSTLSGESALCGEYGTYEMAKDVDNSASRAAWASVFATETLADGNPIAVETFLGNWDAFAGKDMTIVMPTTKVDNAPAVTPPSATTTYVLDTTADLAAMTAGSKADGDIEAAGTEGFFNIIYSAKTKVDASSKSFDDGYASTQRINFGGKTDLTVPKNAIQFTTDNKATVKVWWVEGGDDNRQIAILDKDGNVVAQSEGAHTKNSPYIDSFELLEAGMYYVANPKNNNNFCKIEVEVEVAVVEPKEYILDTTADLAAMTAGSKADGDIEAAGTEGFFNIIYSAKTKVDASSKSFDDGYASTQRINFGGKTDLTVPKNAIQFTTDNKATVKVWWVEGGDDNRQIAILDKDGNVVAQSEGAHTKNSPYIDSFELLEAGMYYVANPKNNNNFCKISVLVEGSGTPSRPPRAEWSTVAAPVITAAVQEEGNVKVTVSANVGYDGADEVVVTMYNAAGNEVASKRSIAEKTEHTLTFTPAASGIYTFKAVMNREGEAAKEATEAEQFNYVLPLGTPSVTSVTCLGGGKATVAWTAVAEAERYIVSVIGTHISTSVAGTSTTLEGLTIGETYTFVVVAVRGTEESAAGSMSWTIVDAAQRTWSFAAFGSGVNTSNNKATGSVYDGNLKVESTNNKGKLVAASTDGLAFYYTKINPATENFTLSADITVDQWTFSNGQEGFGMMAADAIGTHGDASTFWNNSYMATVTKVEYKYNSETNTAYPNTGDYTGSKYSMYLGVGAQEKIGVTPENIASGNPVAAGFTSTMLPLDMTPVAAGLDAGSYNIVGNATNQSALDAKATTLAQLTTFHLEIQRNNTGYFLTYKDAEGNTVMTQKFYHGNNGDALTQIDPDNIYVGFFASRNAVISIDNVQLTTIHPSDDAPAEERPITLVTPNYTIESSKTANSADYELVFYANADGELTIEGPNGTVVSGEPVAANSKRRFSVTLDAGRNDFKVTFTPDPNYVPGEYSKLESYDPVTINFSVTYKVNPGDIIYISPVGTKNGTGTKDDPMDIYTAVAYAAPGQKLYLMEGTYNLQKTVSIARGINGTQNQPIYLVADPEATTRPVLDFGGICAGMVLGGDYWYLQGFDVTKSAAGQKGLQISGDHNTIDDVDAYRNGNTGIQISRLMGTDTYEDWPSYNLVLNCTSYLNADPGYEDADGFAAKLTIADGNVFDGCIAAYNADDGWDLFAKIESGPIGSVTIKNCLAFKNGYDIDANGNEINAGNGNGFKMGGSSMTGYHVLENSIAFANKAKGIDSNSCPDIQVKNSVAFNNGSYNVAFYTNDAANTDYSATGIVSYKDANGNTEGENLKPKGTQDQTKIYGTTNYYFPQGNSAGAVVTDAWFVSLDTDAAINGGITRNADGTINMGGYLELTDAAAAGVGADLTTGTPSNTVDTRTALEVIQDAIADVAAATDAAGVSAAIQDVLALPESTWDNLVANSELVEALNELAADVAAKTGKAVVITNNAAFDLLAADAAILSAPAGEDAQITVTDAAVPTRLPDSFANKVFANAYAVDVKLENAVNTDIQTPVVVQFERPATIGNVEQVYVFVYGADGSIEVYDAVVKGDVVEATVSSFGTMVITNINTAPTPGQDFGASEEEEGTGAAAGGAGLVTPPTTGKGDDKKSPQTDTLGNETDKADTVVIGENKPEDTAKDDTANNAGEATDSTNDGVLATPATNNMNWMLMLAGVAAVLFVMILFFYNKKEEEN